MDTRYYIDVVLCIDKTGSMQYVIEEVKQRVLELHPILKRDLEKKSQMEIGAFRIKVIAFGCIDNDTNPFYESRFFEIPSEEKELQDFVLKIPCEGGGNESGLNALSLAMKSDWVRGYNKMRQIIMIITDEDSNSLEKEARMPKFPENGTKTITELEEIWEGKSQYYSSSLVKKARRMVVVAPSETIYHNRIANWQNCDYYQQEYGEVRIPIEEIADLLTKSITSR